jgi:hypothetical protein
MDSDKVTSRPGNTAGAENPDAYYRQAEHVRGMGEGEENGKSHPSPMDALHQAKATLTEIGSHAQLLLASKIDALKLTARNIGVYAALGIIGLLAAGALVVTSVVLICVGLAEAIARGLGDSAGGAMWAGNLIVGVGLLSLLAGGVVVGLKILSTMSKRSLVRKYEQRLHTQRQQFGRDTADRAAAAGKVDL